MDEKRNKDQNQPIAQNQLPEPLEQSQEPEEEILSQMIEDQILEESEDEIQDSDDISQDWHTSKTRRG